jgi:diguanylate cyclase (GGDEF)-like protein
MTFEQAATETLSYLRANVAMGFWSVTRVENGRQTFQYLDADDHGLVVGESTPWEQTFCIHMINGSGPHVAPDVRAIPVYAQAAADLGAQIGAYAGVPIREGDGNLFGVLCGSSPVASLDGQLAAAEPVLHLLGQMLTLILAAERQRDRAAHELATVSLAAETDIMTGLYNRRAWERLLAEQDDRVRRLGDPTVLAILDLDMLKGINDTYGHAAGDAYICRAASAITDVFPDSDVAARLGGDEFGVLMLDCTEAAAAVRIEVLYAALAAAGVAGSVGWAPITVLRGLPAALAEADEAMYAAKRERRALRAIPSPRPEEQLLSRT